MATRIDLSKHYVKEAIAMAIASKLRASKTTHNPLIKELLEREVADLRLGEQSIADTK